jgi:hypothetical protein
VVGGDVLLEEGFCADGEVCLQWARVGRLRATSASFASATTHTLHADALRAQHGVYLDRGFRATASVRLVGANIAGELVCTRGSFHDASGRALDAERIIAEDIYLDDGFTAHGEVRFNDCKVSRQFNATNGEFHNDRSGGYALDCDGLRCAGDVFLNTGFRAVGTVSLTGAEIGSQLNCTAGSFNAHGGYALFADGMTTPGSVYLDQGFRAIGEVRFARATIGRQLVCTDGVFDNQHGTALDLTGLITPGDVLANGHFRATGEVRMRNADITRDLNFRDAQLHGQEGLDARLRDRLPATRPGLPARRRGKDRGERLHREPARPAHTRRPSPTFAVVEQTPGLDGRLRLPVAPALPRAVGAWSHRVFHLPGGPACRPDVLARGDFRSRSTPG